MDLLRLLIGEAQALQHHAIHVLGQFFPASYPEHERLVPLSPGFTILSTPKSQRAGPPLQADDSQGSSKR